MLEWGIMPRDEAQGKRHEDGEEVDVYWECIVYAYVYYYKEMYELRSTILWRSTEI